MNAHKKPKKPTGMTGVTEISIVEEGPKADFQRLDFPRTKEEIEHFIVQGFLRAAQSEACCQVQR
jgi:hypothetical protein